MTKCTYTKLGKNEEEKPHQVTNAQLKKTKEPTANLKINETTGKMNTGVWGLFINSYAVITCLHKINNRKNGSSLIEGNYKGLAGGGSFNKGLWIQFNTPRWAFSDFNQPDIIEPSNLKTSAFIIFGKTLERHWMSKQQQNR